MLEQIAEETFFRKLKKKINSEPVPAHFLFSKIQLVPDTLGPTVGQIVCPPVLFLKFSAML